MLRTLFRELLTDNFTLSECELGITNRTFLTQLGKQLIINSLKSVPKSETFMPPLAVFLLRTGVILLLSLATFSRSGRSIQAFILASKKVYSVKIHCQYYSVKFQSHSPQKRKLHMDGRDISSIPTDSLSVIEERSVTSRLAPTALAKLVSRPLVSQKTESNILSRPESDICLTSM